MSHRFKVLDDVSERHWVRHKLIETCAELITVQTRCLRTGGLEEVGSTLSLKQDLDVLFLSLMRSGLLPDGTEDNTGLTKSQFELAVDKLRDEDDLGHINHRG